MCRLYAQLSAAPMSGKDLLVDSRFSLLKQSNFNPDNLQKDGWGIAVFSEKGEASVTKSAKPVYEEAAAFAGAAGPASSAVIGHLRAASNPRGLPMDRLINLDNTQPYSDGRWAFGHNGTLEIPLEVAEELGDFKRNVKSNNDSEVYFWQFMKFYRAHGDGARAFEECVAETWRIWEKCKTRHPEKQTPYTSLNAVVSDGRELFAFCHAARAGMASQATFTPGQPWQIMSFALRQGRLVVGSEPLDEGAWTRFDSPEVLSARLQSGRLSVTRRRYALAQGLLSPKTQQEVLAA